jgi:hypothetical protein
LVCDDTNQIRYWHILFDLGRDPFGDIPPVFSFDGHPGGDNFQNNSETISPDWWERSPKSPAGKRRSVSSGRGMVDWFGQSADWFGGQILAAFTCCNGAGNFPSVSGLFPLVFSHL